MSEQESMYSYILKQIQAGELSKEIAAHLIHYLKQEQAKKPEKDIAIIGTASRVSAASGGAQFTDLLAHGVDSVRGIPADRRKQADLFLPLLQLDREQAVYDQCGYIDEIDCFDPDFFDLSPREAALMDPHQRLFLQTAWEAIEDAGYGGIGMAGSRTGVFIGHSSDFGEEYKKGIQLIDPKSAGIALPGNIKSIIASRISYLLDLKGPAMVIDTACSSSLVAIHLACRQIMEGHCELALAGGIKLNLFPLKGSVYSRIGVESSDERTKTFDDSSNGTGKGEGVGVILLKPLSKALADRDHIYGVIKGSAINQDGRSIGMTAPDSHAQEEVICQAWEDAGIDPEIITYIEAHGTGTKLGDPIELEGLTRAFMRYTRKSQFCAVGSLKTNVGHLDHASGIAGLLKVIHSLKERKLFPSLHFNQPNRNIDFTASPVYVNDRLQDWRGLDFPRTAGVSSFGLSGTNCHMVVQEAPQQALKRGNAEQLAVKNARNGEQSTSYSSLYLLPLSAKKADVLDELIRTYISYLHMNTTIQLENLCYTASTGRGHYSHRMAVVFTDQADLLSQLQTVVRQGLKQVDREHKSIFYQSTAADSATRLTDREKEELTRQASKWVHTVSSKEQDKNPKAYASLAALYVAGATIDWDAIYANEECERISLPVYPFQRIRCWVESPSDLIEPLPQAAQHVPNREAAAEQLLHTCRLSADVDWELNEHRIGDTCVLPGTAYIERVADLAGRQGEAVVIRDLAFLQPLRLRAGEICDLHIKVVGEGSERSFSASSQLAGESGSLLHAEGKLHSDTKGRPERINLSELQAAYSPRRKTEDREELARSRTIGQESAFVENTEPGLAASYITTGLRWDNITEVSVRDGACLVRLRLPEACRNDLAQHRWHPALLDNAVNIAIRSLDQDLYLPFYYGEIRLYGPLPAELYSEVIQRQGGDFHASTATFDVRLFSPDGDVLGEIHDYMIKKVNGNMLPEPSSQTSPAVHGYVRDWVVKEAAAAPLERPAVAAGESVLVLEGDNVLADRLTASLKTHYTNVVTVSRQQLRSREDYHRLAEDIRNKRINLIVHTLSLTDQDLDTAAGLDEAQARGYDSLYDLLNTLYPFVPTSLSSGTQVDGIESGDWSSVRQGDIPFNEITTERDTTRILLVTDHAHPVTGGEKTLHPRHSCMLGLGKVAREEYARLDIRCVDLDELTPPEVITRELLLTEAPYQVAYRSGQRYVERLSELTIPSDSPRMDIIRDNGVYVITGGAGGLGLEIGKWLSRQAKVQLHLLSRRGLENADNSVSPVCTDITRQNRQHAAVQAMRTEGADVWSHAVDISDEQAMQAVIREIHAVSGRIDGVIHCAGVAGEGLLWNKSADRMQEVLNAKVKGTRVLDQVTQEDEPDFFVMFSSITSLTGGIGQGDYTAANSYLDTYGSYMQQQGRRGITVNWPLWEGAGMAEDYGVREDLGLFASIQPERGTELLGAILGTDRPRIITGEINPKAAKEMISASLFHDYVLPVNLTDFLRKLDKTSEEMSRPHSSSNLSITITDAEFNNLSLLEQEVAGIWAEVLGLDHIAIHEKFNSMGGNSIFAIDLFRRLERKYGSLLNVSDVFTYATISEMAEFIAHKQAPLKKRFEDKTDSGDTSEEDTFELLKRLANQEISVQEAFHTYKK